MLACTRIVSLITTGEVSNEFMPACAIEAVCCQRCHLVTYHTLLKKTNRLNPV